uniref:Uncharacterized protein n=1 Tax=Anguilla anguilla TaxID=7936 RepID=A0A0E9XAA5_ANGAN
MHLMLWTKSAMKV